MKKKILIAVVLGCLMVGCGQSGRLYLPEQNTYQSTQTAQ